MHFKKKIIFYYDCNLPKSISSTVFKVKKVVFITNQYITYIDKCMFNKKNYKIYFKKLPELNT